MQANEGRRLVVAQKFLPELRMLPMNRLSHSQAMVENALGRYSGIDIVLDSRQHADVCQIHLTQNLRIFQRSICK